MTYLRFTWKFLAVLKLLVENYQSSTEETINLDISATFLALIESVARFTDPTTFRMKIKCCVLCDSVSVRTDGLVFSSEGGDRNGILNIVIGWIQDPAPVCIVFLTA